jgi:predicted aconitase with swiveling domain
MFGRGVAVRLVVGVAVAVTGALMPVGVGGAQEVPSWTLSLTVTKTVEGEGLAAFIAAHPELGPSVYGDIYQVTATCSASATTPDAEPNPVGQSSIDLAAEGSTGSASVTLGAGKQATIPITVEDASQVAVVSCVIFEIPIVTPAVAQPGPIVECQPPVYQPSDSATFTADGQAATLNVVNECVGRILPPLPAPPPLEIAPEFTG